MSKFILVFRNLVLLCVSAIASASQLLTCDENPCANGGTCYRTAGGLLQVYNLHHFVQSSPSRTIAPPATRCMAINATGCIGSGSTTTRPTPYAARQAHTCCRSSRSSNANSSKRSSLSSWQMRRSVGAASCIMFAANDLNNMLNVWMSARSAGEVGNVSWLWMPSKAQVQTPRFWSIGEPHQAVAFDGIQFLLHNSLQTHACHSARCKTTTSGIRSGAV